MKHFDVVASVAGSLMEVRRSKQADQAKQTPRLKNFSLRKIAMNSKSIIVAALFSALTLPVFAQTGAPAATTPAAATAAPKATAKHTKAKHTAKKAKAAATTAAKPATTSATEAAPAKTK
ncbi:hypothetical protein [Herbaspirillum rhizosphaerae]|uniref:hypothetical protein n=1 Tax=Herbaspirillum rhizosphaerae TaxID=346179 RepID=UPI003083F189